MTVFMDVCMGGFLVDKSIQEGIAEDLSKLKENSNKLAMMITRLEEKQSTIERR